MKPSELRLQIQTLLKENGYYDGNLDSDFGPKTFRALQILDLAEDTDGPPDPRVHLVKASSFADPGDIHAFLHCKKDGGSDRQCFKVGDNGIGVWGDDTTLSKPMVALPPEIWKTRWGPGSAARGKAVIVTYQDKVLKAELRDTMPKLAHITNHAGIDMNGFLCEELGIHPPVLVTVKWAWADDMV